MKSKFKDALYINNLNGETFIVEEHLRKGNFVYYIFPDFFNPEIEIYGEMSEGHFMLKCALDNIEFIGEV